ncbi:MAG: germination protein YpeB [Clostridiaceae bacterium]|nr:germination protein YpeB [Clostridiaceae bacterium]
MGFREKLQDYKRRLSDRKMYSIVIAVIGAISIWGLYQYKNGANLRQQLDNQYNRALYDMIGYVNNVEMLLIKSLVTSTPEKTASILQEAWRQANFAQAYLGQLPVEQNILANTSKFLTQVGDYSYSLNNSLMGGNDLTDEQYNTIENLYGYAAALNRSLDELQGQISSGRIKWRELEQKGPGIFRRASANVTAGQFENIDKTFQEYPELIYDGPFSDHLATAEPKGITGDMLDVEQAKQRVIDFFGKDRVESVENTSKNDTDPIRTYSFTVKFKNVPEDQTAVIDVTQKGGHPFWMIYNRPVSEKKIDIDKAKEMGKAFLESRGFDTMVDTYYLSEDNTATINYAYKQGDVVVYPDLVKLKVALDTGEVIGLEAKGYLSSHRTRDIPSPKVTKEQALAKINRRVNIVSSGLAIIPTDYKTELFTYEFKGRFNNQDFIIYINALTGREENVLVIIDTPNGILTM